MILGYLAPALCADDVLPAAIIDLDLFGASYHTNRYIDWRERNPGVGLTISRPTDPHFDFVVSGGTYIDSMDKHAQYLLGGGRAIIGDRYRWHGAVVLEGGYSKANGMNGITFLPVLQFGYDRFSLCVTGQVDKNSEGNPGNNPNMASTSVIAFFVEYTVWRF
jgi:hypothetical protein